MTDFNKVRHYYSHFDEKNRLRNDNSGKLEFLMTMQILEKYLPHVEVSVNKQVSILDLGGGAGVYITDGTNIVFTQGADGTWSTTQSFGAGHPDDLAEWPKLFTDYCVNYADVSAANPICFVKK